MNDATYLILGLSPVLIIAVWWIYSLLKTRRKTRNLETVLKRDDWKPYPGESNEYTVDVQDRHFAYTAYNTTMDWLADRVIFDTRADSKRSNQERDLHASR